MLAQSVLMVCRLRGDQVTCRLVQSWPCLLPFLSLFKHTLKSVSTELPDEVRSSVLCWLTPHRAASPQTLAPSA